MDNLDYKKYFEIRESRFEKIKQAENEKKRLEVESNCQQLSIY